MGNFSSFISLVRAEVTMTWRKKANIANSLAFYLIVISLFPLSLGPETALLQRIGPGVIWVAALLAGLISIERLFRDDWDEGVIDQMRLVPLALAIPVLAKATAHWFTNGLPALFLTPVIALLYGIPIETIGILLMVLAIGTPILSLIGTVGVALTVAQKAGSALLTTLILPFLIPVLIFGTGAVELHASGQSIDAHISLLSALLILSLYLTPWAAAMALRISSE